MAPSYKRKTDRPYSKRGAAAAFIDQVLENDGDVCVEWPFAATRGGYGSVRYEGIDYRANRLVCELVHGAPPSRQHEAAHSCGNSWCVNPRHLRWATPAENTADKAVHGTILRGSDIAGAKLTEDDVRRIRAMRQSMTLTAIAGLFGVTASNVCSICSGKSWGWVE